MLADPLLEIGSDPMLATQRGYAQFLIPPYQDIETCDGTIVATIWQVMVKGGWVDEGPGPPGAGWRLLTDNGMLGPPLGIDDSTNLPPGSAFPYHSPGRVLHNGAGFRVWVRAIPAVAGLGGGYNACIRLLGDANSYVDPGWFVPQYPDDPSFSGPMYIAATGLSLGATTQTGRGGAFWLGTPIWDRMPPILIPPVLAYQGADLNTITWSGSTAYVRNAWIGPDRIARECGPAIWPSAPVGLRFDGGDQCGLYTPDARIVKYAPALQVADQQTNITGVYGYMLDIIGMSDFMSY